MIGYYILSGILFLFLLGVTSIICDTIFNKEEEEIVLVHRKPQEENFAKFIADNYTDADYDDVDEGLGF